MIAMPEPSTFKILPWDEGGEEALLFCDVLEPDGTPYSGDPRSTLKRVLDRVGKRGWTFTIGPELEYFYFTGTEDPGPLDHAGYFDLTPPDLGEELRKKTIVALDSLGIAVECSHHEVAPSQQGKNGISPKISPCIKGTGIKISPGVQEFGIAIVFKIKILQLRPDIISKALLRQFV